MQLAEYMYDMYETTLTSDTGQSLVVIEMIAGMEA